MKSTATGGVTFSAIVDSFKRPYPVTISMIVLVLLIPFNIFIGELWIPGRALHVPAIPWDNAIPLMVCIPEVYEILILTGESQTKFNFAETLH